MSVTEDSGPGSEFEIRSLADLLLAAASVSPGGAIDVVTTMASQRTRLTYDALLFEARQILAGLRRERESGFPIVLLLDNARDFLPVFWACVLGGYVPCPMSLIRNDRERWIRHLSHLQTLLDNPLFIVSESLQGELPGSVRSVQARALLGEPSDFLRQQNASDTALLMLTSGSTGNSKAVALSHAAVIASVRSKRDRRGVTSADVIFNWVSFDHVAALVEAHILALLVGANQVHVQPELILADPVLFLTIISQFRVTLTFTPNFLLGQINAALSARGCPDLDLSSLRHIMSGGEANVVETGSRFLALLASRGLSGNSLWPAYGMTETCAAAVYSSNFPDADKDREFASVGQPVDGLEMRIVDEKGASLTAGESGELEVRGSVVFSRYYNNPEATQSAFTEDGWFRTGDRGVIDGGRLRLVGRSKDSIIVNGVNYFSHEVEAVLEELDGIERSFVAAFPTRASGSDTEQLVIAFAPAFSLDEETRVFRLLVAVKNTATMLWGFRPSWIIPLAKSRFPKTNLGKIQRTLMRARFQQGEFSDAITAVSEMTKRQVGAYSEPRGLLEGAIASAFAEILGMTQSSVGATASFFDLGGTSMEIIKFTTLLEQRFQVEATLTTVLEHPTVRELATFIESSARRTADYDPLVALQNSGENAPLFCIHPGDGGNLVFVGLAKYFVNDRPVYALRPRGTNKSEKVFESLDEIVESYLTSICRRQPMGPYVICGYSLGGLIAFEIAKRLEAQGKCVAFVGAIDSQPPEGDTGAEFAAAVAGSSELLEAIDARHFAAWARVAQSLQTAARNHVASGRVAGMTVFCSDGLPGQVERQQWSNQLRGWNKFAARVKYVEVEGDHMTLMGRKHIARFQNTLRREIDAALAGH